MRKIPMFRTCVSWPRDLLDVLDHLQEHGREIRRSTFFKNVELPEGPDGTPFPAWDRHIAYYKLGGTRIYWAVHSAIEHVFADDDEMKRVTASVRSAEEVRCRSCGTVTRDGSGSCGCDC